MKFEIDQRIFIRSLEETYKAIDSINFFLPLRNFCFELSESNLIIKSSNGNFSIESKIKKEVNVLEIHELGKILVPSILIINIVKKCSGLIKFELIDGIIKIQNGMDKFEINSLSADEYPSIDFELYGTKLTIDSSKLKNAIKNVIFATATKENEMILGGINLKLEKRKLIITATDSFRIAQEFIEIDDDRDVNVDVTVLNKNIKELIPTIAEGEIDVYISDYKINVVFDNFIIQSKIIDAPYKDVSNLFLLQSNKTIKMDRKVLNDAINKATVIIGDNYNRIRMEVSPEKIDISSINETVGNTNVVISKDLFTYDGDKEIITLNFKYLKEAIGVFENEIELHLNEERKNVILITSPQYKNNKQIISQLRS